MALNPYESPLDTTEEDRETIAHVVIAAGDDDDDPVSVQINIPAFGLSVIAWMRLVFEVPLLMAATVLFAAEMYASMFFGGVPWLTGSFFGAMALAVWFDILMLGGSSAMLSRSDIRRARRAAWLTLVPVSPLFVLSVPFGLWALRVLSQPDVQVRFIPETP